MTVPYPAVGDPVEAGWGDTVAGYLNLLMYPILFIGTQATPQAITNSTPNWLITLDTEVQDPYNGHSTSVNPARYTVPAAYNGYRLVVHGLVTFAANSTGARVAQINLNGSAAPGGQVAVGNAGALPSYVEAYATFIVATGDHIELACEQLSGGSLNTVAGSQMEIRFGGLA